MSAKSLSRTAPRSHSLSSSCCLWSHERLPQGSAPAGSLVWCTEQLWGSQEALSGFSLWRSLVLAIWKDGSCSGTGSKMSWLHSAGKTHCCKIPGLTWIPWDGTKQMCLLRQAAISWITLYIWQEINLLSTTLTKVFYFVPSFSLWSLRISRFLCVTRKNYHRHLFASKRHYDLLLAVNIGVQCIWSLRRAAHTGAEQKGKWESIPNTAQLSECSHCSQPGTSSLLSIRITAPAPFSLSLQSQLWWIEAVLAGSEDSFQHSLCR